MYIDCYAAPVRADRRDDFAAFSAKSAQLFKDNGATRVVDGWADDVPAGEVTSFPRGLKLEEGEAVVLGWVEYPDKATRDACMGAVMADPFMQEGTDMVMDGKRMIFGGFDALTDV